MESIDKNLIIDLIENQNLSYEESNSVLKKKYPGVRCLSSLSDRRFCIKWSVYSRVTTG